MAAKPGDATEFDQMSNQIDEFVSGLTGSDDSDTAAAQVDPEPDPEPKGAEDSKQPTEPEPTPKTGIEPDVEPVSTGSEGEKEPETPADPLPFTFEFDGKKFNNPDELRNLLNTWRNQYSHEQRLREEIKGELEAIKKQTAPPPPRIDPEMERQQVEAMHSQMDPLIKQLEASGWLDKESLSDAPRTTKSLVAGYFDLSKKVRIINKLLEPLSDFFAAKRQEEHIMRSRSELDSVLDEFSQSRPGLADEAHRLEFKKALASRPGLADVTIDAISQDKELLRQLYDSWLLLTKPPPPKPAEPAAPKPNLAGGDVTGGGVAQPKRELTGMEKQIEEFTAGLMASG